MLPCEISVRLHGHLARYAGGNTNCFSVPAESAGSVEEVIRTFNIPPAEVGMVVVNGRVESRMDTLLHAGDEVKFFGLVGGG